MDISVNDCPVWDNRHIFASLEDPAIEVLLISSTNRIQQLAEYSEYFACRLDNTIQSAEAIGKAQVFMLEIHNISIELSSVRCFIQSIIDSNAKNEKAKELFSKVIKCLADLAKAKTPLDVYLDTISDDEMNAFLNHEVLQHWHFQLQHRREHAIFKLGHAEEKLLSGLEVDGLHAWGDLYRTLSGQLVCDVDGEPMGLAKAATLTRQGDRRRRESAWRGINAAWEVHQESAAAILNAINGWRHEENTARSTQKPLHYLDQACHQSHITRKTLDVLMQTTFDNIGTGHRALKAMAKGMGVDTLAPWDILAPAPTMQGASRVYGFGETIEIIAHAFARFTPEMGEFARMMWSNQWIDAKETAHRAPGAYCAVFAKQREPRVFMTYDGSMGNVITLAHEIGHAYHNWVMRDLHVVRTAYAMTTAETASIFAETLVRNYLFEIADSDAERFEIAWQDAQSASTMLCNIPARYEFEKSMVEKRQEAKLSTSELKVLTHDAWKHWYQDTLTEYDQMYWANKLHFSISSIGFYNYPYLFGYLFSLGIYAEKNTYGDGFDALYIDILRDTGSMNAVELIQKHLGKSIEDKAFWQGSLDLVEQAVTRFESLLP